MTGTGVAELALTLGESKIHEPVHRDGLIARTALLERLTATPADVPLVLLTVTGATVTGDFFATLGAQPVFGRLLTAEASPG